MTSVRLLTAYEKNQLQRNGFNVTDEKVLKKMGEMPVEYFVGEVIFSGHKFKIDQNVLIPRIETEELVEIIKKDIESSGRKFFSLLEVGTGSGAIGLSLARFLENKMFFYDLTITDVSSKALNIAKDNFKLLFSSGISQGKIIFLESNLLTQLSKAGKLDYIVANLPYIPSSRLPDLNTSVKDFEPTLALDGGENGFDLIEKLIEQAESVLKIGGKLFLEVDDTHTTEFFKKYHDKWKTKHINDQFKKNRFVVMEFIG